MAVVRLDPWQNIVGVGWGGKLIGHLEVWMDLRTPAHGTDNPSAAPNRPAVPMVQAKFLHPSRDDFVRGNSQSLGTDPHKEYADWDRTCHQEDAEFEFCIDETHNMPTQEIVNEAYMTAAGHFRIYPFGDTGGLTVNKTLGGATNFLINWGKVTTAEFLEAEDITERMDWPPLEIGLYGSVDAQGPRLHSVKIRLRLLRIPAGESDFISLLNRQEPAWLEFAHDLAVSTESNELSRSFSANFWTGQNPEDVQEHIATARVKWGTTEEPGITMEVVAP